MGLFGGFKAKFTRNTKPKGRKSDAAVVAKSFKIQSEFDNDTTFMTIPLTKTVSNRKTTKPKPAIKPYESTKTNEQHQEYHYDEPYDTSETKTNSKINIPNKSSTSVQRSPSTKQENKLKNESSSSSNINKESINTEEDYNKSNSIYTSYPNNKTNMTLQLEDSNYIYTGISGSIHHYEQVTPQDEDEYINENEKTPSTLIMMTQHEPEGSNYKDESDDFKVNIVKHDNDYVSEDDLSYVEEEPPTTKFNGYSQAASIFFGESSPAPPLRPRRVITLKSEKEDSEEDC